MNTNRLIKDVQKKIAELYMHKASGHLFLKEIQADGSEAEVSTDLLITKYQEMLRRAREEWEDDE